MKVGSKVLLVQPLAFCPDMKGQSMQFRLRYVPVLLAGFLSACSSHQSGVSVVSSPSCSQQLGEFDALIADQGKRNVGAAPVAGYRFLRANRNSVLMGKQVGTAIAQGAQGELLFADWVAQMRALDRDARADELRNLPVAAELSLTEVENCASQMAAGLTIGDYASLSKAVFVPDDYLDFQRIAGFYPLTAFAAHFGYESWKRDNFGSFDLSEEALQASGPWQRYRADGQRDAGQDAIEVKAIKKDAFGRIIPTHAELKSLAERYAPEFRIRTLTSSDRIGTPALPSREGLSIVDLDRPAIYYRLSHTWFNNQWRPQIIYSVWFPERPAQGMFDILAGHLDALIWRVTLDGEGHPLIADSIHGCGCYHMFFPTSSLQRIVAPEDGDIRETAESPAGAVAPATLARPVLWVDAISHYLLAVTPENSAVKTLTPIKASMQPEQSLASIPLKDGSGYESLYDEDGFVPGTERMERFILWPMGVDRPGAMRQWGHHATAFVGRRHFDEPALYERYFELR